MSLKKGLATTLDEGAAAIIDRDMKGSAERSMEFSLAKTLLKDENETSSCVKR